MEEARMTSEGHHAGQQPADATSGGQAEPFGDEGFPPDSDGKGRAAAAGFPNSYAPPPHATPNGGSPFVVPTVFGQPGAPQGQPGQVQPNQVQPGQAPVPDPADRTTPPPFAPPTPPFAPPPAGSARVPAPGDGTALPQRSSTLPQRAPTGSDGAPPSAWAPPSVPQPSATSSDDPFGRPAETQPYRSGDDSSSGFTGFAPGSPTRVRAGLDESEGSGAPFERPESRADRPGSGSPFGPQSSGSAFERPPTGSAFEPAPSGSAFERPPTGSAFERPPSGSAFERRPSSGSPSGSSEFGAGQPAAPLGRPGSLPERPASGAAGDRPPGLSAFGDQRVRVPGATLTGLPDAPTSGRGGQPDETPGALPNRTPTSPDAGDSSQLPRRGGGGLPARGQSGPADEPPFGAPRDNDSAPGYRPGAAQPFGQSPSQPFGARPQPQPFDQARPQPFGESPAQPFGEPAAQPFGEAPGQPYGQAPAQPYGESPSQPYGEPQGRPYGSERPSSGAPSGPQQPSSQQYGRPASSESVFGRPAAESPFGPPAGDSVFGRQPADDHPYARPASDTPSPFAPPAAGGPISGGPTSGDATSRPAQGGSVFGGSVFGGSAAQAGPGASHDEAGSNAGPVYGNYGAPDGARPDDSPFGADRPGAPFDGASGRGYGSESRATSGSPFGDFGGPGRGDNSGPGPNGTGPNSTPGGGSLFGGFVPRGSSSDNADGPPFGGGSGLGSADNGLGSASGGYTQRVPGASLAAGGMPVGTEPRNGSVPQPRDPAEPPTTGTARAVSASASVPTASRVAPVDPDEVPPPVAAPQARVYGRPAQPSEPDDDADRPEPGDPAYPSSGGPAAPPPGRVAGRATASARVAPPGSEPAQAGPPFTEPTTDVAGRGRPAGPEVQPGAPLPPDRYGENTTDISHRGAGMDPTYVPAPAVSSMHARPPLENGFPPAPDADQGFDRPDRPRMGGLFPGPATGGASVAPPNADQTSSWPGVPAQVPDDDQARFGQFRPDAEAPPAKPETPHVRMLPILISVIVGAALLVGLAIGIVWLISRGSDSGGGISVAAGECVKRSGDEAIKAQCGDAGVFQVVSIADTKEQCADQAQPYVLNPTKDGKTQVLCLKPSS
jgi:collagen type III alpha